MRLSWLHVGGSASEVAQLALETGAQLDRSQFEILPFVPNSEIIGILKAKPGAVFINVSSSEGVPVSIMEAMASGLAIIATDVGSTKSIVLEPANLLLPGQGSLTEWSELVSGWLRATNLGDTALKNARFAAEKFDHIRNYEALVKHVIHG
jgi:glycosyltransferase involved in cell wall biosynthesis